MPALRTLTIDKIFLRMLLRRLFLPSLLLIFLSSAMIGYGWYRTLGRQQLEFAGALSHNIRSYLSQAKRVMLAVAQKANERGGQGLEQYVDVTQNVCVFFDTLMCLNSDGVVTLVTPYDPGLMSLDMSGQKYLSQATSHNGLFVSSPTISLRTSLATVMMVYPLKDGGFLLGELNLDALQSVVATVAPTEEESLIFIVDKAGNLLAHKNSKLVQQKANMAGLPIIGEGQKGNLSMFYMDRGSIYQGSYVAVRPVDWGVVVQAPMANVYGPFLMIVVPGVVLLLLAWLLLAWTFRRQFRFLVLNPLTHLGKTAARIESGDLELTSKLDRKDEIGMLAGAMDSMTTRLKQRIRQETFVADLSRKFVNMPVKDIIHSVEQSLGEVGCFVQAQRCNVYRLKEKDNNVGTIFQWRAEGVSSYPFKALEPIGTLPWIWQKIIQDKTVVLSNLDMLPQEAILEKEVLHSNNIHSLVCIPMGYGKNIRGFMSLEYLHNSRVFSSDLVRTLQLVAEVFVNALERHDAQASLAQELQFKATIAELSEALISPRSLNEALGLVLDHACELTQSSIGYAGYIEPESGELVCPTLTREVWDACCVEGKTARFKEFTGMWGSVLNTRKSLLVNNVKAHSESKGVPEGHMPIERFLSVPSLAGDTLLGQISVANAQREYTQRDLENMERLAILLGIALQRTQANEALATMARELEQRVAERTGELEQKAEELVKANEQLLELDELKSSFLSSVSHELRTPLTSVRGFAKLSMRDFSRLSEKQTYESVTDQNKAMRVLENLQIIETESLRLTRLINDVLDLSKIESGKMDFKDERNDLQALIESAVKSVAGVYAHKRDVTLSMYVEDALPKLRVDPDRMMQVLINLLDNAAKFTHTGSVEVKARTRQTDDGTVIRVEVLDTGQGIQPEDLEYVFDKFHQAIKSDTLGDKPSGTGLGLAICKQIIEHYNGRIWAAPREQSGTMVVFELPA